MGTRISFAAFIFCCCVGCGGVGVEASVEGSSDTGSSGTIDGSTGSDMGFTGGDTTGGDTGGDTSGDTGGDTGGGTGGDTGSGDTGGDTGCDMNDPTAKRKLSLFAGHFVGSWSTTSGGGTADLVVAPNGKVTGQLHDTKTNSNEAVTGRMRMNGTVSATVASGLTKSKLSGALSLSSARHLAGSLTEAGTFGPSTVKVDLAAQ